MRWSRWLVAGAEIFVGGGIGLAADSIFDNSAVAAVVQIVMPFVGAVAGISTLLLDIRLESTVREELTESREAILREVDTLLERATETLDAHQDNRVRSLYALLPFFNFYLDSSVADPLSFRSRIVDDAVGKLRRLAAGEIELEDSLYYEWLTARLRSGVRTVRAINVRPLLEFETDPREEAFLTENHAAIKRGAEVTRIYVIQRSELFQAAPRSVLYEAYQSKVLCYVAWQEDLSQTLLTEFRGGGMSIYDSEDIFWDRSHLRYSYVTDSRDSPGSNSNARLEASVFRAPHPKFASLRGSYSILFEQYVPSAFKARRGTAAERFRDVLQDLLRRSPNMPEDARTEILGEIHDLEAEAEAQLLSQS